MKKTILLAYQAIIIIVMLILAGYFMNLGKPAFAVIYVLLALGGFIAARNEHAHRPERKTGNK